MKLQELITDDDAVSPVIGVILMVAITVILAAVIGTFVLGLGEQTETAPQASFSFQYNQSADDYLNITHESGEAINSDRLSVSTGVEINSTANTSNQNSNSVSWTFLNDGPEDVKAGSGVTIYPEPSSTLADQTVRVVWNSESGSSSATLQKWTGPNA
ncbi:type IV pilin [Haloferax larsenii]|uniref:Flagellin N-terminal-like domain-containing protein n=1 Tax=Haloferax larsenii TaxID=302484 RepID=A0A1H7QMB2_HALLR|nr:type IV pilin N-terminal domain-containing protein [Haloferax larsenii]SEL49056.1 flagellin N-terminal-like domain-containing protein [Haloferax larsenii]